MQINITEKEVKLLVYLLTMARDKFDTNICNYLNDEVYSDWSEEEKIALVKKYEDFNSKGKDFDPKDISLLNIDWAMFDYFQMVFKESLKLNRGEN